MLSAVTILSAEREEDAVTYRVAGLHPTDPTYRVVVPDAALEDRRQLYELDSDEAALEHIWIEHLLQLRAGPGSPLAALEAALASIDAAALTRLRRVWGHELRPVRGLPLTQEQKADQRARFAGLRREPGPFASEEEGAS